MQDEEEKAKQGRERKENGTRQYRQDEVKTERVKGMEELMKEGGADKEDERQYAYWLCSLPGIGGRTQRKLLELCGTPRRIYEASEKYLKHVLTAGQLENLLGSRKNRLIWAEYEEMRKQGIGLFTMDDEEYPLRLKHIPDPPYGLFVKGRLQEENRISAAIIGARDCSEYGRFVAIELGRYLGEHGVQVISGMARGIDGISQEAALLAGGASFGVMGCGVDICYPAQNRKLYERLCEKGGILSCYPPGTPPRSNHFPPRNRIVSGLADAVVVIEARQKSGTLITVDMALEQGKDVYVVPGRITDRLSDGCNKLLKQGAGVFLSPAEFLREIRENFERTRSVSHQGKAGQACEIGRGFIGEKTDLDPAGLPPDLAEVYGVLDFYPRSVEEIGKRLSGSVSAGSVGILLMRLCMEDVVIQVSPGQFCLKAEAVISGRRHPPGSSSAGMTGQP